MAEQNVEIVSRYARRLVSKLARIIEPSTSR